tara:strand:+ start:309 stop:1112 length:804 start_codon:yes stop_codon:yes gene_type:complete
MSKPIHLIVQNDLLRDRPLGDLFCPETRITSEAGWQDQIIRIEASFGEAERPLVIASIQVCGFIRRNAPKLARGIIADFESCRFSRSMALAPRGLPLNDSYILLPFGEIQRRKHQIQNLFGDRIFLRPDDSRKGFSGFSLPMSQIDSEISALRQLHNIHNDELCVIDKQRDFRRSEYRCWLIAGEAATAASYSHFGPTTKKVPPQVLETASRLAVHMELYHDAAVADFAINADDEVRLIEINAISTSGIYPGADINKIVSAMDQILI